MAQTAVIGRVSVRVFPDTSNFRRELKRQLAGIDEKIKVPVDPDKGNSERELRDIIRELRRKAGDIDVDVDINEDAKRRLKDSVKDTLKNVAKLKVDVDDDSLKDDLEALDEKEVVRVDVKWDIDRDELIDNLNDVADDRKIEIDERPATESLRRLVKSWDELSREAGVDLQDLRDNLRDTAKLQQALAKMEEERKQKIRDDLQSVADGLKNQQKIEESIAKSRDQASSDLRKSLDAIQANLENQRKIEESIAKSQREAAAEAKRMAEEQRKAAVQAIRHKTVLDNMAAADAIGKQGDSVQDLIRDMEDLNDEIEHTFRNFEKDLKADPEFAKNYVDELKKQLKAAEITLEATLDPEVKQKLRREIREIEREIEDLEVNIEADATTLVANRQLAWAARDRIAHIIPVVDKKALAVAAAALGTLSGVTGMKNAATELKDAFKGILDNLPKLATLGTLIGGLGLQLGGSVVNAISLAGSLTEIVGLLPAMPALLTGLATATVTMVVAFSDFERVLPKVVQGWKNLKGVISDAFWANAKDPIQQLSDEILPEFETGLDKVAGSLGTFFGDFATGLKDILASEVDVMFDNLSIAIERAAGAARPMAGIITTLGRKGSEYLPSMADWFVEITTQFDKFLANAEKTGELDRWIQQGVQALKDLGSIAVSTTEIFFGLADAATKAGGSVLSSFADTMERISDKVNSESFQNNLTRFFRAILEGADEIESAAAPALDTFFASVAQASTRVLPNLGRAFGALVGGIAEMLSTPGFKQGMYDLTDGLADGFEAARPYMKDIGDGLGVLLGVIGDLARDVIPAFAKALAGIANWLVDHEEQIDDFIENMGDLAWAIANGVTPALSNLDLQSLEDLDRIIRNFPKTPGGGKIIGWLEGLGNSLKGLDEVNTQELTDIADIIDDLAAGRRTDDGLINFFAYDLPNSFETAKTAASSLWEALNPVGLGEKFGTWMREEFVPKVKQVATDLWTGLVEGIKEQASAQWTAMTQPFLDLITKVKELFGIHSPSTVFKEIGGFLITGLIQGMGDRAEGLANKAVEIKDKIVGAFEDAGEWLKGKGSGLISGLRSGINEQYSSVTTRMQELKTGIRDKFSDATTWLHQKGANLVSGLRSGINQNYSQVTTRMQELKTAISQKWSDASSFLQSKGSALVNGLRNGINSTYSSATSRASELKTAISNTFSNANSLLYTAGSNIASGLANGIRSGWSWVTNAAWSIANAAVNAAKNRLDIHSPSRVFREMGEFTGEGFALGIEDKYKQVFDAAKGMASAAALGASATISPTVSMGAVKGKAEFEADASGEASAALGARVVVNQTVYNPVTENTSQAVNSGLQTAALFG